VIEKEDMKVNNSVKIETAKKTMAKNSRIQIYSLGCTVPCTSRECIESMQSSRLKGTRKKTNTLKRTTKKNQKRG
jgi:hypothetical protein